MGVSLISSFLYGCGAGSSIDPQNEISNTLAAIPTASTEQPSLAVLVPPIPPPGSAPVEQPLGAALPTESSDIDGTNTNNASEEIPSLASAPDRSPINVDRPDNEPDKQTEPVTASEALAIDRPKPATDSERSTENTEPEGSKVVDGRAPDSGIDTTDTEATATEPETTAPFNEAISESDRTSEPLIENALESAPQTNSSESESVPEIVPEVAPEATSEATSEVAPDAQEPRSDIGTETTQASTSNSDQGMDLQTRSFTIGERAGDVVKILDRLSVSTSQLMVQQTPVDTQHGYVYTANIEHGPDGDTNDTNLRTVVRQGQQQDDGSWQWTQALVENRTVHNRWHTAPSVVADNAGYVHVAYNMHNFPWQYKRSTQPHDISSFDFLGQAISKAEIDRSKYENKTTFPTLGQAAIPGNQITYPAFFKDRNNDIYATYRFAAKPKRSFPDRTMSGGIAAYDTQLQSWRAIGAQVPVEEDRDFTAHQNAPAFPVALASETGWTVYHPRLMFGPANELHVNWFFREGIAGAELSRPCYIKSMDTYKFTNAPGNRVSLPMASGDCGNIGYDSNQSFYSIGNSAMDSNGKPHIVLSPIGRARQIVSYNAQRNLWEREQSPNNATEIFFDGDDNLWAVAKGVRVMVRLNGSSSWDTVYFDSSNNACFPKVSVNETGDTAFIHTHACDQKSITLYAVRLN